MPDSSMDIAPERIKEIAEGESCWPEATEKMATVMRERGELARALLKQEVHLARARTACRRLKDLGSDVRNAALVCIMDDGTTLEERGRLRSAVAAWDAETAGQEGGPDA